MGQDFYVCPLHPETHQDHPGICTKCSITKRGDYPS
ncbi:MULTISPECIES: heavy metal-binding domain-containing protein [unclassified Sulfurovum]